MTHQATAVGALQSQSRASALAVDAALVLAGSMILALSARVSVPFWPVPLTAQTLAVMTLGAALGARRGAACVLAYLAEGAAGLPVFAAGGGAAYLAGPTAGYLFGFVPAAWVVGALAERGWDRRPAKTALAMLAGHAIVFACGVSWLAVLGFGMGKALTTGLLPFLPGCAVKIGLGTTLLPFARRFTARR